MEKALQAYLNEHIPITRALGVVVEEATFERVILWAPFANNINHKKTVFGGSLHAVATLSCWCLVYVRLQTKPAEIVISKSDISYLVPVASDFRAVATSPDEAHWQRFFVMLERKGKAKIELAATIHENERLAVTYQANFVALQ